MKKFFKNNESFVCVNCGKTVEKHLTTSRDHCNFCLYGLHVDINPGDRLNTCKGLLKPIGLKISNGKTQIVYNCQKCSARVYCIASKDDDTNKIIELSNKSWVN